MDEISKLFNRSMDLNETDAKVFMVMVEALDIFQERNEVHENLWKSNTLEEGNLHIGSKYKRFVQDPASHIDDGLDLINYVVFQILNVREGRV